MKKKIKGFTLIELLIVIAIIAFLLSMSAPMLIEFSRNKDLKGAGQILQSTFIRARSVAISEKTEVRVIAFIDGNNTSLTKNGFNPQPVTGVVGSIHTYVFDKTAPFDSEEPFLLHTEPKLIPDRTRFLAPITTKEYIFHPSGVILFSNDKDNDPEDSFDTDVVIQQLGGSDRNCYVDIVRNTGRMVMSVR